MRFLNAKFQYLIRSFMFIVAMSSVSVLADDHASKTKSTEGFTKEQVLEKADGFFGETTAGLAKAIEKVFAEQGSPNAIIAGEEVSAALGVGVRYGQGEVQLYSGDVLPIFWQGPSLGFDMGANASKVFTLVYNLTDMTQLMQRIPGVDGSFYVVAGVGVNYQKNGDLVLAPIRTGVGLRAGASVGYVHYSDKKSWIPF
ncbi:DUF1134 domain-containing protein [Zhongshania aquimaris]|uniref:DUF1134 domain-containing protein n=1 Tax=Zhongshania aquimaris TaxID=2857107 RepID=A0ABS6VW35_9GAMM|nr:DUF1134 domain-containing protein [Zhongshania aquimaris]MBW2942572.1 DUF1134 domain-containing protein [Zhongshania aquimaris]|tara:strand:- start:879 stop:1475 length:597 start_codon:yes stop_codon:yes gene_type:complete